MKKGFTLVELLIYISLSSIVTMGIIQFALDIMYSRAKSSVQREVAQNMRLAAKRIVFEIRNASSVQSVSSSVLCLASTDSTYNPVKLYVSSNRLRVGWGGGSADCATTTNDQPLTSNEIVVTNVTFTDLSTIDGKSKNIRFSLTMNYNNPSGSALWNFHESATGSAELRSL